MRRLRMSGHTCAAILLVFLLTACGTANQTAQNNTSTAGGGSEQTGSSSEDTSNQAEAEAEPLKKVRIVRTINNMIFMPLFVAIERGYFAEEGIEAEIISMGGADATQALISGSVDFTAGNGSAIPLAYNQGSQDLLVTANIVSTATASVAMRNPVVQEKGISIDMPIDQRLKAFQGITYGVLGIGSADDTLLSLYLDIAGLERGKDVRVVAIGDSANMIAGLKQGQIDAFMASPPTPQTTVAEGYGTIIVKGGEVEGTKNISWDALATHKNLVEKDPELVRGVTRAIARGNNFARNPQNLEETIRIAEKNFPNVDPQLIREGIEFMIEMDAWPEDARMTEEVWINQIRLNSYATEMKEIDTSEGHMWTNEFLEGLGGLAD